MARRNARFVPAGEIDAAGSAAARRALVFPGQGSQAVGMGRELAARFQVAERVFEEVDEALGQHLSRLMANGPEAELTLTENAQPALMAVSMAMLAIVRDEHGIDIARLGGCVAGHSLRCKTWSASTSTRRRMRSCCRWTKRTKFRRSTAPSPACR